MKDIKSDLYFTDYRQLYTPYTDIVNLEEDNEKGTLFAVIIGFFFKGVFYLLCAMALLKYINS